MNKHKRGPRSQIDRDLYKFYMQQQLRKNSNLDIIQSSVQDFIIENNQMIGIKLCDQIIYSNNVVLTTGTFLKGVCHIGKNNYSGGRHLRDSDEVEPSNDNLSNTLQKNNFKTARMKTGTPPRLLRSSLNLSQLQSQTQEQQGYFSYLHEFNQFQKNDNLIECYLTHTNQKTHELVCKYKYLLPTFDENNGLGNGPRYCPSIESKVYRFPEKQSHQIWLEPEGLNSDIIYPNGFSNGFPADQQLEIIRTVKGLEQAKMIRPGYQVEYEFCDPRQLNHTLETQKVQGLFLAGQINGTTGYEEAACQGLIAGINAGLKSQNKLPFVLDRCHAMIGVLIDDLVTQGVSEPYRMFTSRAEFRLSLRADNADERLTNMGINLKIVTQEQQDMFIQKQLLKNETMKRYLEKYSGQKWMLQLEDINLNKNELYSAHDLVSDYMYPIEKLQHLDEFYVDQRVLQTFKTTLQYKNYLQRQKIDIEKLDKEQKNLNIENINYQKLQKCISNEEYHLILQNKPKTLYAASRLQGIRPTTLLQIQHLIKKQSC